MEEIDKAEGIAWVCYPEYENNNEHHSYPVKLTEEIFRQGKVHRLGKFQRGGVPP